MQAGPSYEYEPPKPLPDIHFQRTKILLHTSEYNEMFAATADRLEPVFAQMEKEEGNLELEVVAKVRRMSDGFDELYHGLEKKARWLTNRHWRVIKRDLKRIGHVSFEDLSSRLPEICNELASLNITFKYEVNGPIYPFVLTEAFAITTEEEWHNAVFQNVNVSDEQAALLQTITANAAELTTGQVRDWIGRLTLEISRHYDGYLQSLLREVESLHIMVQNQQALVNSYKRQVDALPALTGSGHSHQPKIGEPPAFKGSEDKTKLEEWLDLIVLWCEHEGVATDKQRIVMALLKLQGPAHHYMKSYYVKMQEGKDLGTWKAFVAELAQIYRQRDDKEGAKKEITMLFINKDLASKDFVKYAERFRTLGRLTEYDDSLLIDKLREVIPRDMWLVLAGKDESTLPKDWTLFLDILLNINKIVNPEKARGLVFKNSGSDNGGAVPMDINSAEKSKSKGKGKGKAKDAEAASTEAKKYCVICKSKTHNTDDCYKLAKNVDKRPKTQGDGAKKAQGGSGNPAVKKAKKTRVIQVELTDSEDDTPPSMKAVSANTARIEKIANVEKSTLAGKDEPQLSAKTEPTAATSDFWKKYM
ncbi:predicted protein [Postia placenta Mad-698-R]|nr:predicted protein [Postia placenta Mad-698-R]